MKFQTKARVTKDTFGNPMLDFNKVEYRKALQELKKDSYCLVTITDQRTLDQNSMLHAVINEISAYTGESLDDLKAFFKHKFLGYVNHEVTDYICDEEDEEPDCTKYAIKKTVQELRSTTTLNKTEFANFITQIQSWAWENLSLNLNNIPDE